jgi:hypothetical protein
MAMMVIATQRWVVSMAIGMGEHAGDQWNEYD